MIDLANPPNPRLVDRLVWPFGPPLRGVHAIFVGAGWDNAMYRIGADIVARFPRNEAAVGLLSAEQRLFEVLPALSVEVPKLISVGQPTEEFPHPWSLMTWIDGDRYIDRPAPDCLFQLARFLVALHRPAPPGFTRNPYRGTPLYQRDTVTQTYLARLPNDLQGLRTQITNTWHELVKTPSGTCQDRLLHGDLHPGNLLTKGGRLHAVIDWGDSCSGDPASDLSVAWMVFDQKGRNTFRSILADLGHPADDSMWRRARGWALSLGLAHVTGQSDKIGRQTITEALTL